MLITFTVGVRCRLLKTIFSLNNNLKMENNTSTITDLGNDANRVLCPVFLFRFFFRSTFSDTNATNEELDEINVEFSDYLRKKCTQQQLQNFMPKSEIDVILNKNHPLRTNGFDPAFVLHFLQFAEIEAKKHQDSIP